MKENEEKKNERIHLHWRHIRIKNNNKKRDIIITPIIKSTL